LAPQADFTFDRGIMRIKLISAAVAAAIAAWAAPGAARETVPLSGVVGPVGVVSGVDTTGPGTLTVGNQNINTSNDPGGAITSTAAAANVVFTGNSTVTGITGTAGLKFSNINAGAVGTTVNFNGAVFTTTFGVTGTGTVNFFGDVIGAPNFAGDGFINLAAGHSLNGAITTNTAGTGTLTLNGGSSVIGAVGGANGLRMINVVGGNTSINGAVQSLGFNLGANTLNITGALTTNAGASISTTLVSNLAFGQIIPTGASNINAGGITVVPTVTGALTTGTTFRIVNAGVGTAGAPVTVINNNPRYLFSGLPTVTGNVSILLTAAPLATLVTAPGAIAVGPVLDINAAPGSDLLAVQNAIAVLPNTAAINNALAQLAPGTVNLAAPGVAGQTARNFDDMWMARVDEIQDLCCNTCEPNKPEPALISRKCKVQEQRGNWWAKAFDNQGRQRDIDGMNGYQTKTTGLMLAYDKPVGEQLRAGVALGIANTSIDGNNSSGHGKVGSYQLTGYAGYAPGPLFVQGALSAGVDNYTGARSIVFPGVNRTANADYTGQHYSALVAVGQHFYAGQTTITPLATLQASRIHVGSYTETGAGDVNLRIATQDYNLLQSSLGVKAERVIATGSGTFSPEVHARWMHDFNSTTMQENAAFTGGGGSFTVQGIRQGRELYNVGAGISILSCGCDKNAWTIKGLYDYKWNRSDYSSHQVSLIASLKF